MLKIALCDDNKLELNRFESYISQYKTPSKNEIYFEAFLSPVELLSKISSGVFYDLIFLDVLMPVINGMDVAREIFKHNKLTQIIFLTSSREFAADSYSVSALDYIIKPITDENLTRAMDKFFERYKKIKSDELVIREKSTISRIPLHNLSYVEVLDHHLIYHLSTGYTIRCRQSLNEIEDMLIKNGETGKALDHISSITEYVDSTIPRQFCLNGVVNVILSHYANICQLKGISFICEVSLSCQLPVSDIDLVVILSNILENTVNALEICDTKRIEVKGFELDGKFFFEVKNPFCGEIEFKDDLPVSRRENHGYGTKSIAAIVEKREGIYSFTVEDDIFVFRCAI